MKYVVLNREILKIVRGPSTFVYNIVNPIKTILKHNLDKLCRLEDLFSAELLCSFYYSSLPYHIFLISSHLCGVNWDVPGANQPHVICEVPETWAHSIGYNIVIEFIAWSLCIHESICY